MAFSGGIWQQLKNLTADDLCHALARDGWACDMKGGSARVFVKAGRRVAIHVHPGKTYGAGMLRSLLNDIGWADVDLYRLKLVK